MTSLSLRWPGDDLPVLVLNQEMTSLCPCVDHWMTSLCPCFDQGMIQQLIDYNLRHGALSVRLEVRSLLCLLTRDNRRATEEMNNLIMTRITAAVKGHQSNPDMVSFCLPACVRAWCMCVVINAVFFKPDPCCEKKGKEENDGVCVCACVCVCVCICVCV